ncbi:T9SS type A sorting domain-containing protein [Chryseobacterium sp. JJR-5R]|uniref:T9SS type A sorting domain-containing protein n=1 Tax=Chryseobacterium sp. JJR-5R TaxID=3093923 RepID=UPI002A7510FA|nr:T9SS type A sorting domain-containing protein [Chryseobacterium sp. JJR-5R]WPO81965.1 T9SS type A sorting domain-containing protein [Chryseobacterium sp. JJR-5R]
MRHIYILILFISFTVYKSQVPSIQWSKYIGGTQHEVIHDMKITSDGGYVFAGKTYSLYIGNIFMNHHGNTTRADFWILKTDSSGNIQWTKSFGGSEHDIAYSVQQTPDGGFILAGTSESNNGDVTDHKGFSGSSDSWVLKLDSSGNVQWKKSFGGVLSDYTSAVILTADGNYLIAGSSYSNDGDLSGHHGSLSYTDGWLMKIDTNGNVLWSRSYGGGSHDMIKDVKHTSDGGYIIAADSYSNDGDIPSGHHGDIYTSDIWIVKTDINGNIQWQKSVGGSNNEKAGSVEITPDGGLILAGESSSGDGDVSFHFGVTQPYPAPDFWLVKTDVSGNIQWEKSYGGTGSDIAMSAKPALDGGYIIAGDSSSTDGDVTEHFGGDGYDYWTLKVNATGNIIWQKSLGGINSDNATDIYEVSNGYVVAGSSTSNSQNVYDLLLYKLSNVVLSIGESAVVHSVSVYPNPSRDIVYFSEQLKEIEVYSVDGKLLMKIASAKTIDLSLMAHGEYLLKGYTSNNQVFTKKLIKR